MKIEQGSASAKNKKLVFIIAGITAVVVLTVAAILLGKSFGASGNEALSGSSSSSPISEDEQPSSEEDIPLEEIFYPLEPDEFDPTLGILSKFVYQFGINPDFIGHLTIPNTLLDTDVVQGKDDKFYLTHTLEKEYNPYGIPFVHHLARFTMGYQSQIVTIHGHNSKHGDFFESVKDYSDIEYYRANPLIYFDTIYGSGVYKIIGRYTTYTLGKFYPYHEAVNMDEANFKLYMEDFERKNYYLSNIDYGFEDKFLVLSTCNDAIQGPKDTPYRDILVARKVREGESIAVDVSQFEINEDMVMPEGWQKRFDKENPYR